MVTETDHSLWKRRATAFAVRSHRHLWGKNNEDPLAFLFNQGLSNAFAKALYLGWNKFGQERPLANWGMAGGGRFIIPPGIVFPHILEKELISLFIISMDAPSDTVMLPGSDPLPVVLGNPEARTTHQTKDLLDGLKLLQDNPLDRILVG